MALSSDEEIRRRTVEFIISRWLLDHDWKSAQVQGLFLGCPFSRADFFKIIRDWLDDARKRRAPEDY
jgi:hypothetical protein